MQCNLSDSPGRIVANEMRSSSDVWYQLHAFEEGAVVSGNRKLVKLTRGIKTGTRGEMKLGQCWARSPIKAKELCLTVGPTTVILSCKHEDNGTHVETMNSSSKERYASFAVPLHAHDLAPCACCATQQPITHRSL